MVHVRHSEVEYSTSSASTTGTISRRAWDTICEDEPARWGLQDRWADSPVGVASSLAAELRMLGRALAIGTLT